MQSEQIPPSQSPSSPVGQTSRELEHLLSKPTGIYPDARGIASALKNAASPLDFIKNNLKEASNPDAQAVNQIVQNVETQRQAEAKPTEAPPVVLKKEEKEAITKILEEALSTSIAQGVPNEVKPISADASKLEGEKKPEDKATAAAADTKGTEAPAEGGSQEGSEPTEGVIEEPHGSSAENFKKLRTSYHETKKALEEKEAKLQELNSQVEKYKKGEVKPEVLANLEERIKQLSKYEKAVALKTSPEYQEKFLAPVLATKTKLLELGKEYGVPEHVMAQALTLKDRPSLNRFLASHFDDIGALDAREMIRDFQDKELKLQEAEKEPEAILTQLTQEAELSRASRTTEARKAIASTVTSAWVDSLTEIAKEGKAIELIHKDNDPEFNQNFVDPIVTKASKEYGMLINMLVEDGLDKLSPKVAKALAKMVQLAHASAVAIESRDAAIRHADEIETNTQRTTSYTRPPIGSRQGGAGEVGSSSARQPMTPQSAAEALLKKVGVR